ncbi:pre-mRNA-splicing factor syf1 [Batrachochytrium dendrobatidis]|nr:pre-mRNA-splicing factor syf1 [Batrachochytrium dendrobatidis]
MGSRGKRTTKATGRQDSAAKSQKKVIADVANDLDLEPDSVEHDVDVQMENTVQDADQHIPEPGIQDNNEIPTTSVTAMIDEFAKERVAARQSEVDKMMMQVPLQDLLYEEDCLRHPFTIKSWTRYIAHLSARKASFDEISFIFERAIKELPGSYKLWKQYLDLRVNQVLMTDTNPKTGLRKPYKVFTPAHKEWLIINGCFEKSLALCNKFPVIWLAYCRFLMHQPTRLTFTRRTFDRALKALPTSQHKRIWPLYLEFAQQVGGEICVRSWLRFLKLEPHQAEQFVSILLNLDPPRHGDAARVLAAIVMNPKYASPTSEKTAFQHWVELCDVVCEHPEEVNDNISGDHMLPISGGYTNSSNYRHGISNGEHFMPIESLDVDCILRVGIARFTDQVGKLWNSLARWWIVRGEFDRARDVYEEGIRNVTTVRDFSMIFDAYAKMEENIIASSIERLAAEKDTLDCDDEDSSETKSTSMLDAVDVDMRLARFEKLMERRSFLINDVLLRQNPHNVQQWKVRAQLYQDANKPEKIVESYVLGTKSVSPQKAHGKLHDLWIDFAKYYESIGKVDMAHNVFEKAVLVPYKRVDDLAQVWCEWVEMDLRHNAISHALEILGRATAPPRGPPAKHAMIRYNDETKSVHQRLFKCIRLWSLYVDVEESIGTPESTKAVYDRIMELKIATPQIIINYASFLEENKYFEESFRVYERGIDLFGYPIAFEIWNLYLVKFVARYGGSKMERIRDLFEQSLEKCPPKFAKTLFLLYADLEENHGLARHAMRIYDRATRAVSDEDRAEMFQIYISKATSSFGLVSTREIYQRALETLPDTQARDIAIKFADMETKLGEVDRSRAILAYASQFCDPRIDPKFWKVWHDFEVKFGNEDTFKETLRIKRSVQAKYNTDLSFISSQILAARQTADGQSSVSTTNDPDSMKDLEAEEIAQQKTAGGTRVVGFVRAEKTEPKVTVPEGESANPDAIEIDDDSSDEDDDDIPGTEANMNKIMHAKDDHGEIRQIGNIQRQSIPAGVFGALAAKATEIEKEEAPIIGAKDRFSKRKRD